MKKEHVLDKEPGLKRVIKRKYGTGKFYRQRIPKPLFLKDVPRYYYRYGLSHRLFLEELNKLKRPQAVLVTSGMTYWYPGLFEVIRLCKGIWPDVPIILGGIYATLCYDHIPLAFELLRHIGYVCLLTSKGCPFRCPYCASYILQTKFSQRSQESVFREILFWHKINFHTPNGLHARFIDARLARFMYKAGFKVIRLGLETISDNRLDSKNLLIILLEKYRQAQPHSLSSLTY